MSASPRAHVVDPHSRSPGTERAGAERAPDRAPDRADGSASERAFVAAALALLVLLVGVAFAPAFRAHFVNWDDIANTDDLRAAAASGRSPWRWFVETGTVDPYQPLSWLSLSADRALWGLEKGLDAPQAGRFHATSVLIHAGAALLFFFVARRLFALGAPGASARARIAAAALAAAVFAIHPLRCESVAWITERRDVFSGFFYLFAVLAWLRATPPGAPRIGPRSAAIGTLACAALAWILFVVSIEFPADAALRWKGPGALGLSASVALLALSAVLALRAVPREGARAGWFALALVGFALAAFSKSLTIVLPAVLLVLDVWPLARWSPRSLLALVLEKAPLFALSGIVAALAVWAQRRAGETLVTWESHTLSERLAQAAFGLGFYPSRTLAPLALRPMVELPDTLLWSEPRYVVSALAVVALTVLLIAKRKRFPAALAAWAAFVVAIAPVLGLTQAGQQLVADRYSYLSCMPFALLAGGAWLAWWSRSPSARSAASACAAAVVIALVLATFAQTRTWHDSESLWTHAIAVAPRSPVAHAQLAAWRAQEAADATDPEERRRLLLETDALCRRALELDPRPPVTLLLQFGSNLLLLERPADAIEPLTRYLRERPLDAVAHTNLGTALLAASRAPEALEHLRRATELDRDYAKGWVQLGRALEASGDRAGAIEAYGQVLRLWPAHKQTQQRLEKLRSGA